MAERVFILPILPPEQQISGRGDICLDGEWPDLLDAHELHSRGDYRSFPSLCPSVVEPNRETRTHHYNKERIPRELGSEAGGYLLGLKTASRIGRTNKVKDQHQIDKRPRLPTESLQKED